MLSGSCRFLRQKLCRGCNFFSPSLTRQLPMTPALPIPSLSQPRLLWIPSQKLLRPALAPSQLLEVIELQPPPSSGTEQIFQRVVISSEGQLQVLQTLQHSVGTRLFAEVALPESFKGHWHCLPTCGPASLVLEQPIDRLVKQERTPLHLKLYISLAKIVQFSSRQVGRCQAMSSPGQWCLQNREEWPIVKPITLVKEDHLEPGWLSKATMLKLLARSTATPGNEYTRIFEDCMWKSEATLTFSTTPGNVHVIEGSCLPSSRRDHEHIFVLLPLRLQRRVR
eukprot:TRINITY_DN52969_c0_g1_i1.p2 TRINITY_DN52969_c0_g1~~TRINITY_DN52969_c0_g1_i1.p2  ORF type:complete len:281 (+),score=36.97 TRINITY_DN52969_c0_g1_i1:758-1600(+)